MPRPQVIIKEESIAAAVLSSATGRTAYVVEAVDGPTNDYIFVDSEKTLREIIGTPTNDRLSREYHVCQAFLNYGNDLVLRRAIDRDTAQLSRLSVVF